MIKAILTAASAWCVATVASSCSSSKAASQGISAKASWTELGLPNGGSELFSGQPGFKEPLPVSIENVGYIVLTKAAPPQHVADLLIVGDRINSKWSRFAT